MSDFVVPDFTEEFVGWRGWNVTSNGHLQAIVHGEAEWKPGEALQAKCAHGARHPVPFMRCECGFYATNTYEQLVENGYHLNGAFGTASMWGRSITFTHGLRTQFAYPREIYLPYTMLRFIEPLSVYGVPVRLANPYTFKEQK